MPIVKVRHTAKERGKEGLFTLAHGEGLHTAFDPGQEKNVDLTDAQLADLRAGKWKGIEEVKSASASGPDQKIDAQPHVDKDVVKGT